MEDTKEEIKEAPPPPIKKASLGARKLKRYMKSKNLSYRDMGKKFKINHQLIQWWESGRNVPTIRMARKFLKIGINYGDWLK